MHCENHSWRCHPIMDSVPLHHNSYLVIIQAITVMRRALDGKHRAGNRDSLDRHGQRIYLRFSCLRCGILADFASRLIGIIPSVPALSFI